MKLNYVMHSKTVSELMNRLRVRNWFGSKKKTPAPNSDPETTEPSSKLDCEGSKFVYLLLSPLNE